MTLNSKSRMRKFTITLTAVIALSTTVAFGGEWIIFSEELPPGADFALRADSQFAVSDSDPYQGANHLERDFATWGSWAWITGIMNLNLDLSGIEFDTAYLEFYIDSGTTPIGYLELRLGGAAWDPDFQTTSVTVDDQPGYELVRVMLKDFTGIGTSSGVSPTNLDEFTGSTGMIDRISWGFEAAGDLLIDEVKILDAEGGVTSLAAHPVPAHGKADVPREPTLGWRPGQFAATHDVYLGTVFEDVSDASRTDPWDVLLSQGQAVTTFDPDLLEFGTTYYWRVDEVNAAPDNTVFKGEVWSFTTEPFAYPIGNVTATSNGTSDAGAGPENTVNGSGLNANDEHSVAATDMWLASEGAEPLWLRFEFDQVYKLHEMLIWNYNVQFELILGFGLKDVTIGYSTDGVEWRTLGDAVFAQATAQSAYEANTTIDLGGVAARYVRITVNNGYGMMGQYGLSEVRFMYIPATAREPEPADGAANVGVNTDLTWRAGRDALSHEVALGTDPAALPVVDRVSGTSYTPGALDLATTYYWQLTAVQEAESWVGAVWDFVTQDYLVVDDFESYDDEDNRIYDSWFDGWVNETGSTVGYLEEPFAEQLIVHSGGQSMPLFYDNTGAPTSEADFELSQNWTLHGIQSLSLYLYGDPTNTDGRLYVKINGARVDYDGSAADLSSPSWHLWNIDLSTVGDVSSVTSLTIGIEGAGASGVLYIDDIRLYP